MKPNEVLDRKKRNIEELAKELSEEEKKNCTFKPKINDSKRVSTPNKIPS